MTIDLNAVAIKAPRPPTVLHQALGTLLAQPPHAQRMALAATGHWVYSSLQTTTLMDTMERIAALWPLPTPASRPQGRGRQRYAAPIPPAPQAAFPPLPVRSWSSSCAPVWRIEQPWLSRLATMGFAELLDRLPELMEYFDLLPPTARQAERAGHWTFPHGGRSPDPSVALDASPYKAWCRTVSNALGILPMDEATAHLAGNWTQMVMVRPGGGSILPAAVPRPELLLTTDRLQIEAVARAAHEEWPGSTGQPLDLVARDWSLNPVMRAMDPDRGGRATRAAITGPSPKVPFRRAPVLRRLAENDDWDEHPEQGLKLAWALLGLGARPDGMDHQHRTALHTAVEQGRERFMGWLLDRGAPVNTATSGGCRPVHLAVQADRLDLATTLLDRGAQQALDSIDPTVDAAMAHRVVQLLADDRAQRLDPSDPVDLGTNPFSTPLHWAVNGRKPMLVRWLVQRGADPSALDGQGENVWDVVGRLAPPAPFAGTGRAGRAPSVILPTPVPARVLSQSPPPAVPVVVAPARVPPIPVVRFRSQETSLATVAALREAFMAREQRELAGAMKDAVGDAVQEAPVGALLRPSLGTVVPANDPGLEDQPSAVTAVTPRAANRRRL